MPDINQCTIEYRDWIKSNLVDWQGKLGKLSKYFGGMQPEKTFANEIHIFCKNSSEMIDELMDYSLCLRKSVQEIDIITKLFEEDFRYFSRAKYCEAEFFPEFKKTIVSLENGNVSNKDWKIIESIIKTMVDNENLSKKGPPLDKKDLEDIIGEIRLSILEKEFIVESDFTHYDPYYFFKKYLYGRIADLFYQVWHKNEKVEIPLNENLSDELKAEEIAQPVIWDIRLEAALIKLTSSLADPEIFKTIIDDFCPFGSKVDKRTKQIVLFLYREVDLYHHKSKAMAKDKDDTKVYDKIIAEVINDEDFELPQIRDWFLTYEDKKKLNENLRQIRSRYTVIPAIGLFRYHKTIHKTPDEKLILDIGKGNFDFLFSKEKIASEDIDNHFGNEIKFNHTLNSCFSVVFDI